MKYKNIGIIGAGPASLIFAINYKLLLPESNITIYEKLPVIGHKIGESLLLPVVEELKHIGLYKSAEKLFLKKRGASYKWGKNPDKWWDISFRNDNISFHVRRSVFDKLLADKAQELGVKIKFNTKIEVLKENKKVRSLVSENGEVFEHEYYIDGSGLSKTIIKKFERFTNIKKDKRIAFYAYFKNFKTIDSGMKRNGISIISFNKGWIWHIPLDDSITSIGIVTSTSNSTNFDTKEKFIKTLMENKDLGKFITDKEIYDEWGENILDVPYSVKNWSYTNGKIYGDNWLAIGDAAYFHDPILSQGVTLAVASGHDAALALYNNSVNNFFINYYKEFLSLKKMTDFWYNHNSIKGWEKLSEEILKNQGQQNLFEREAFSYLTLGKLYVDNKKSGNYFGAGFIGPLRKIIYKNLVKKEEK